MTSYSGPSTDGQAGLSATTLSPVLDLANAQTLFESLKSIGDDQPVTLDASAVERMSTPCVQILLAKARAVTAQGSSFRIVSASPAFVTALSDIGLEPEFKNWML